MSKNKEVIKNIGLGLIIKPVGILIGLFLIPLSISYLGVEKYGIWVTILSIISWINYFDVGIGNGLRNQLTKELALKNYKDSKEFISTAYVIITIISLLLFMVLGSIVFFLNWRSIFNSDVYDNKKFVAIIIVNLIFVSINFVLKIVTSIYYALQKSAIVGIMQILNQGIIIILLFLIKTNNFNSSIFVISYIYGFSMTIINIIFTLEIFLKNKTLIPKFNDFKYKKIKGIGSLGIKFFIIQIAVMIIFTTDNVIISKMFGASEVTPYSVTQKIFNLVLMIQTIVLTPLWSAITKAHAEKDYTWIKKILKKLHFLQILIVLVLIILYFIFPVLLKLWIKENIFVSKALVIQFVLFGFISTWNNIYAYIFNGLGEVNYQLYLSIFAGIINIPLSIFLARDLGMGVTGVILGTNISLIFGAVSYPFRLKKILS